MLKQLVPALLFWIAAMPAHSSQVTIISQIPPGFLTGPVRASGSAPGIDVSVDLATGEFKGIATLGSTSGFFNETGQLRLTYTGTGALVLPADSLSFHVEGTYDLGPPAPNADSSATVLAQFRVQRLTNSVGPTYEAGAQHQVTRSWNDTLVESDTNITTPTAQLNGARVSFNQATLTNLSLDLLMPEITLNPGDVLNIMMANLVVSLSGTQTSGGVADFSHTGRLSLPLPAGASFTNDTGGSLAWATTVPLPAGGPMLAAALGSIWLRRQRWRSPSGPRPTTHLF